MSKRSYVTSNDLKTLDAAPTSLDVNLNLYKILDDLVFLIKDKDKGETLDEFSRENITSTCASTLDILKVFPYIESAAIYNITRTDVINRNGNNINDVRSKYGYLKNETIGFIQDNILTLTLIDKDGNKLIGDLSELSGYKKLDIIYGKIEELNSTAPINVSNDKLTLTRNNSRDYILFYKDREINKTLHSNTKSFIHSIWEPEITPVDNGTEDLIRRSKKKSIITVTNNTIPAHPFVVGIGNCDSLKIILMVRNIPVLMEKRKIKSNYYIFMYPEWVLSDLETKNHLDNSTAYLSGYTSDIRLYNTVSSSSNADTTFQVFSNIFVDNDNYFGTLNYVRGGN